MNSKPPLSILPRLDELIIDTSKVADISPKVAGEILVRLSGIQILLMGRLLSGHGTSPSQDKDELLNVEQAARRLNCSVDWLYRGAKNFPFTVRVSKRQLRFSSIGIDKYLKNRPR